MVVWSGYELTGWPQCRLLQWRTRVGKEKSVVRPVAQVTDGEVDGPVWVVFKTTGQEAMVRLAFSTACVRFLEIAVQRTVAMVEFSAHRKVQPMLPSAPFISCRHVDDAVDSFCEVCSDCDDMGVLFEDCHTDELVV